MQRKNLIRLILGIVLLLILAGLIIGYLATRPDSGSPESPQGSVSQSFPSTTELPTGLAKAGPITTLPSQAAEPSSAAPFQAKTGYCSGSGVRVRKAGSTSAAILTTLSRGQSFTVTGSEQSGWDPVQLSDGTKGFVSAQYVTFTKPAAQKPTQSSTQSSWIDPVTVTIDEEKWYLTLVSIKYRLPENYKPELSYPVKGIDRPLDARVTPHYVAMYNAAKEDGCTLTPYSGWRSISRQKANYENKVAVYQRQGNSRTKAEQLAAQWILPPGASEHNMGLAMDIVNTKESFENTKEFAWLQEHAADYGFILRYPKDKVSITKVAYEPWHWRYVGVEDAKKIKASGQCLEEYLGLYND